MEKINNYKIPVFWYYLISLSYGELLFKVITHNKIFTLTIFNNILFLIFLSLTLTLITKLFKNNINRFVFYLFMFIFSLFIGVEVVVHNIFGFYFDFSLLGATDQVLSFSKDLIKLVSANIFYLLIIFLPFILSIIFRKNILIKKNSFKKNLLYLPLMLVIYLLFLLSLNIQKDDDYSAYKLFFNTSNVAISLNKLGVIHTMLIDLNRSIFGFSPKVLIVEEAIGEEGEMPTKTYAFNNLDIDFASLIDQSSGDLKSMHEYFNNESGSEQNEYTGYFKNKNLILFMAESFNEVAVSKDRTPTLYKLVNGGFHFNNFYTPTISSTIGGEFQELTGLVAASGFLTPWKNGNNSFPFGIAHMFQEAGYNTYAYHDHTYTFQSRHNYLKALGFNNYLGCRNGLEKLINCNIWPESDVEMINATVSDFINSDKPFFSYYVTVSGHGDYSWGNAMSKKHRSEVEDLDVSENAKAYLASQIELDKALETLINKLAEANVLDDTVIALVGDHYPYFLTPEEVNEIASYKKDSVIEINHSNFILWNNKMDTIEVDKVGSQIDVLPTIYNIFNLPYDSRLIIGKDILSSHYGLAIFGNGSWVSDYGSYFANTNTFVKKDDLEIPEDYVKKMNKIVNNKINMSKLIITKDYYKYIK